jgi:hypothetical protein
VCRGVLGKLKSVPGLEEEGQVKDPLPEIPGI